MIIADFYKHNEGLMGFSVSGHAGYSEEGTDIVCASVSSAVQLSCNLISDYFGLDVKVDVKENVVSLRVNALYSPNHVAFVVISALYDHLRLIAEDYPGNILIRISEV